MIPDKMMVLAVRRAVCRPSRTLSFSCKFSFVTFPHTIKSAYTSKPSPAIWLWKVPCRWESSSSAFLQSMMANKMLQNVSANSLPQAGSSSMPGRAFDGYCPPAPASGSTALRVLLAIVVATGGISLGSLCSQLLSSFLEENDIFVPSDED